MTLTHVELLLALIHWTLTDPDNNLDEEMVTAFQQLGTFFAMVSFSPEQFKPAALRNWTTPEEPPASPDVDTWEGEGGA